MLQFQILPQNLTVCKVERLDGFAMSGLYFIGHTDSELSLVCETDKIPADTTAREDGWRALRVAGTLDFSLTGILSKIATVLADAKIGIFAVSTYAVACIETTKAQEASPHMSPPVRWSV